MFVHGNREWSHARTLSFYDHAPRRYLARWLLQKYVHPMLEVEGAIVLRRHTCGNDIYFSSLNNTVLPPRCGRFSETRLPKAQLLPFPGIGRTLIISLWLSVIDRVRERALEHLKALIYRLLLVVKRSSWAYFCAAKR